MGRFATREDEVDDLFRLGLFTDLFAGAVRAGSKRPADRLHGGNSGIERQVLVEIASGLAGEDDRVRR